jgi:hypothetical protein
MEAVISSETSTTICQSTLRQIPEDLSDNNTCRGFQHCQPLFIYLFIYGLIKDKVSSSDTNRRVGIRQQIIN